MAEVTSKNCVGYMANALPEDTVSGTIDVGVNFSNVGVAGGSYTVTDKLFSTDILNGDACMIFNPAAYNYDWYQYSDDIGTGKPGWMIQDMETFAYDFVESFEVKPGDSLVFMGAAPAVTVAGEVADLKGASRTFICDPASANPDETLMPIANPFPIDTPAKMLEGFIVNGDAIMIWNDSAYNYDWYQYSDDIGTGNPGWMIQNMETFEYTFDDSPNFIVLPAGHGGIFMPAVGGTRVWEVSLQD